MSKIEEVRRANGRRIIESYGAANLARELGHKSGSTLSQVFGPRPTRTPTEKLMRKIKEVLNLPARSLDEDVGKPVPASPPAAATDTVATVIKLVGSVLESESLTLPPSRFADVVLLAFHDTMEHGGKIREQHIRSVVKLLK